MMMIKNTEILTEVLVNIFSYTWRVYATENVTTSNGVRFHYGERKLYTSAKQEIAKIEDLLTSRTAMHVTDWRICTCIV